MTNNQLTREKVQWLHDAAEEAAAVGIKLTMNPSELLMFTSSLLAAMDSEPVAVPGHLTYLKEPIIRNVLADDDNSPMAHAARILAREVKFWRSTPLYRHAQPAPVVPEALERLRSIVADPKRLPRRKEWIGGQQYSYVLLEEVETIVDDACRAAMLNGGKS